MFISLTYSNYSRSNGKRFVLRADLVERVSEATRGEAGSVITLTNGNYYVVRESKSQVTRMVENAVFGCCRCS